MANYETIPVTRQQYENIITTMKKGCSYFRPNQRIAFVLMLEANLGMRIEDILLLTRDSFVYERGRYRLAIKSRKQGRSVLFRCLMSCIRRSWHTVRNTTSRAVTGCTLLESGTCRSIYRK